MIADGRISRRQVLSLAGVGAVTVASVSGCAAVGAEGIQALLSTTANSALQAFGLAIGTEIAAEASDLAKQLLGETLAQLSTAIAQQPDALVYGYATNLKAMTPLRTLVSGSFQTTVNNVETWDARVTLRNGDDFVTVPPPLSLGAALFAQRELSASLEAIAADKRAAQKPSIQQALRNEYSIKVWEKISGGDTVGEPATFRAVTTNGRNLEVEWDPTDSRTEQTRVTIREGLVLKGQDPKWSSTLEKGIPSYLLWDAATN